MASRTASPVLQTSRKQGQTPAPRPASTASPKPPASSASPAPPPSATPAATLPDLATLLNLPLRVKVAAAGDGAPERTLEGALFTFDSSSGFLVLSSPSTASAPASSAPSTPVPASSSASSAAPKRTYHFLKTSQLVSVDVLSTTPDPALPPPSTPLPFSALPSSASDLSAVVSRAVAAEQRAAARIGQGVSPDAQQLFDALARTLPVRWAGTSIVVMDEVVVEEPYGSANVKGAKGSAERIERVKRMLEGIRARLGLSTPA
ncbi:Lsm12p [Rhodotorula paludigena]|uniref:Lsm12p n=1 Tax=Rhodotorula paludigena TaxID=86838 RepID=UPI00317AE02D